MKMANDKEGIEILRKVAKAASKIAKRTNDPVYQARLKIYNAAKKKKKREAR